MICDLFKDMQKTQDMNSRRVSSALRITTNLPSSIGRDAQRVNGACRNLELVSEKMGVLGRSIGQMAVTLPLHDPASPDRKGTVAIAIDSTSVERRHAEMQATVIAGRTPASPIPDDPAARMQRECLQRLGETDDELAKVAMFVESVLHEPLKLTEHVERNPAVEAARNLQDMARSYLKDAGVQWPAGSHGPSTLPGRLVGRMGDLLLAEPDRIVTMVAHAINAGMRGCTICAMRMGPEPVAARKPTAAHRFRDECNKTAAKPERDAAQLSALAGSDLREMVTGMGLRKSGALYGVSENEMRKICTAKGFIPAHAGR